MWVNQLFISRKFTGNSHITEFEYPTTQFPSSDINCPNIMFFTDYIASYYKQIIRNEESLSFLVNLPFVSNSCQI